MVEILPSSRSSISVKQSASCNVVYNMIREELALLKQNGAWKPRRKNGWSGLFYPPNGLNFQFCWFNLIFLIAPSWSESNFILFLFFYSIRVGPSRSELIRPGLAVRVDPVRLLYLPVIKNSGRWKHTWAFREIVKFSKSPASRLSLLTTAKWMNNYRVTLQHNKEYISFVFYLKVFQKVEFDRPGERSPE